MVHQSNGHYHLSLVGVIVGGLVCGRCVCVCVGVHGGGYTCVEVVGIMITLPVPLRGNILAVWKLNPGSNERDIQILTSY